MIFTLRVVSFLSSTTIQGILPADLDTPAQSALVITIASLLSIQISAIHIVEISDGNTNRRLFLKLLADQAEVTFQTEVVAEELGYSDPTEMATALQTQLSSIATPEFASSFLSECSRQGRTNSSIIDDLL